MKRWPIIRHLRWYFLQRRYWRWWNCVGNLLGEWPNPIDMKFLDDVWEGRA